MQDRLKGKITATVIIKLFFDLLAVLLIYLSCVSIKTPSPGAGYGDCVYRICGYMCLDSSSQSQADSFKLVFDEQPKSKVRETKYNL